MTELAAELRACLDETTGVPPRPAEQRSGRSRLPLVAVLLALVAGGAVVVALVVSASREGGRDATGAGGGGSGVTLRGVSGYDPAGTHGEHDNQAWKATDGKLATFWSTETYATPDFGNLKSGVGLVLDAGSGVALHSLTVQTDTPGFSARIQAGDSAGGPFTDDSQDETVGASTTFALNGTTARYYVVWITLLTPAGIAHVNEVTAG